MWNRTELKERGRTAVSRNYWKCVLVALILALFTGGGNSGNSNNENGDSYNEVWDGDEQDWIAEVWDSDEQDWIAEVWDSDEQDSEDEAWSEERSDSEDGIWSEEGADSEDGIWSEERSDSDDEIRSQEDVDSDDNAWSGNEADGESSDGKGILNRFTEGISLFQNRKFPLKIGVWKFFQTGFGIMVVYLAVIALILLQIFVFSMLEIGGCRFFIENAYEPVLAGRMLSVFGGGQYGKMVLAQFLRELYTFLWSLLLIIPGIVKSYEYSMIPYLLADYPELTTDEAFRISREMMDGNKWNAFVLDWSFILWDLLSAVTLGIAGIFWVYPYEYATKAELYLTLKADYFKAGPETS